MAEQQSPSIGRIVHYQSHGSPNGQHRSAARAAVITEVYEVQEAGHLRVSLAILNPSGVFFDHNVDYDGDARPGTWRWPPRV